MLYFETAVDAIVAGDTETLERLLREHPELARARSTREHRSTLLHYVSANGVEDSRQKTPPNIVAVAKLLLGAGADVNAESNAYGGGSTALALTATSVHPERAGVQLELLELLLEHGAAIDGPGGASTVNACLANGRIRAAEFLADRGARLDLEAAAGLGRTALVSSLAASATSEQMHRGLAWACEYGRADVAEFLLDRGVPAGARLRESGETGLHWAAYGGHADIVSALLRRGAPVDTKDGRYGGTPLDWALHGWGDAHADTLEAVRLLVRAGAVVAPDWRDNADPRMRAALRRESAI